MDAFKDKTLLVGVGATKCGTSWLYGYLRDHPQIFMSPIKEMHVFNAWFRPDLCEGWNERFATTLADLAARRDPAAPERHRRLLAAHRARVAMSTDLGEYIAYFRRQVGERQRVFGEYTPGYCLLREDGFAALRAQHPRVRLIFLMRDPVARFWSALRMRQRKHAGYLAAEAFDEAWADAALIERGRYDLTLEAIERVFPRDEVWIGFYETLFTPAAITDLCAWAGLDPTPADFERHPNRAPEVEMTAGQRAQARERLHPVYDYCKSRFGGALPSEWLG